MKYDYKKLYANNAKLFERTPVFQKALHPLSHLLTALYFIAYAWLVHTSLTEKHTAHTLVLILGVPLLCLVLVTVLRHAVAKPRPYAEDGAHIVPLSKKRDDVNNSFPSRHVACAFVIATVLLPFTTWLGIIGLVCACLLAYIRFSLGLHYPSDLFGGAIIGVVCGLLVFL